MAHSSPEVNKWIHFSLFFLYYVNIKCCTVKVYFDNLRKSPDNVLLHSDSLNQSLIYENYRLTYINFIKIKT